MCRASLGHALVAFVCWACCMAALLSPAASLGQVVDQRRVGPFNCRAEFPLDPLVPLLGELSQIEQELTRVLAVPAPREPVELMLFRDEAAYRAFVQRTFPQIGYRHALFVKGTGPGIVYTFRSAELAVDLRHESTHGLLHAALPLVPLWLDEGLAEYFEVAPRDRANGAGQIKKIQWNLRVGRVPSLKRLEAKRELSDMTVADYRDAWAWVHFMFYGSREAHQELAAFFNDIRQGTPPGNLSDRLQRRLGDPDQRFRAHFANWQH